MAPRSTYKVITPEVKAIRALRERRGLSVNKVALLIGTNKSTLTAIENGRINLSKNWIDRILKAYKYNDESFENKIKELSTNQATLIDEIIESVKKLNNEKLILIKQLLRNFIEK
jgi:transcriptional regulator with XRE-family HTH domain